MSHVHVQEGLRNNGIKLLKLF